MPAVVSAHGLSSIKTGGGDRAKSEDQPHAKRVAHAPQPSMWGQDAEWESVPVPGDAERPLSNARRNVIRSS